MSYTNRFQETISTLKIIGISDFVYTRITADNKFFVLSNSSFFTRLIVKTRLLNDSIKRLALNATVGKLKIEILNFEKNDLFWNQLAEKGIQAGLNIALPFEGYIDIFSFFSNLQVSPKNRFYLRHFGLLKRFIIFFRLKYKEEIEVAANNLLDLKENIKLYSNHDFSKKYKKMTKFNWNNFFIKDYIMSVNKNPVRLTDRDKYYLSGLLEGKNIQVMAKELHISPRTIESSLETLKSKTGYRTRAQLIKAVKVNQAYLPKLYYDRYY